MSGRDREDELSELRSHPHKCWGLNVLWGEAGCLRRQASIFGGPFLWESGFDQRN